MNTSHRIQKINGSAQYGFTLVELFAVLGIAMILAGVAVPSLGAMVKSTRLTSAANDLFGSMMLARAESATRGLRVALCKSNDGMTCAMDGGWDQGWIVFEDANDDGRRNAGEPVLQHLQAMSPQLRVSGNLNVARYLSYSPAGVAKLTSGAFQAGTITLCNVSSGKTEARQIILSASGRPRVQRTTISSCV